MLPRAEQVPASPTTPKPGQYAHANNSPNGHHAQQQITSTEDVQLQLLAVTVAFEFVAALLRAICALRVIEPFDALRTGAYLGCVCVFLEWVRMHPEFIPRAPLPTGSLWDNLAQVLNSLASILFPFLSFPLLSLSSPPAFLTSSTPLSSPPPPSFLKFFYAQKR